MCPYILPAAGKIQWQMQLLSYQELKGRFPLMKSLFYQISCCYTPQNWQPFKRFEKLKALFEDKGNKVICFELSPAELSGWPFGVQVRRAPNCFIFIELMRAGWQSLLGPVGTLLELNIVKYCNTFPLRGSASAEFAKAEPIITHSTTLFAFLSFFY